MQPRLLLHPSLQLACLLIGLHLAAIACVILSAAPSLLKLLCIVLCGGNAWWTTIRYALLSHPTAIISCHAEEENIWRLTNRRGEEFLATLSGNTWRSQRLIVLSFKIAPIPNQKFFWLNRGKRISVLVFYNAVEPEVFRRLQGYLTIA